MSKDRVSSAQVWGVLVVLCGLLSFAVNSPRVDAAALNKKDLDRSLASSPLTEEQKILHVFTDRLMLQSTMIRSGIFQR